MRDLRVADDIISVEDLESRPKHVLEQVRESGRPVVITHDGCPAGVLLSPESFHRMHFMMHLAEGLADSVAGRVMDTEELNRQLDEEFGGYADFDD